MKCGEPDDATTCRVRMDDNRFQTTLLKPAIADCLSAYEKKKTQNVPDLTFSSFHPVRETDACREKAVWTASLRLLALEIALEIAGWRNSETIDSPLTVRH